MRFRLQFSSKIKKIGYKFAHFWNLTILFLFPAAIIMFIVYFAVLFLLIELEEAGAVLLPYDFENTMLCVMIFLTAVIGGYVIWKTSIYYVELTPKGIFIHHGNFSHYGLRQFFRINVNISYARIVNCKIGIPVDCPPNFRYTYYNQLKMIKKYFDLKQGKEVEYMKEPAIAGGRYDEECILLELDNKRIVVIPIDECNEFLELFNQYFEQYKELCSKREREK